MRSARQVGVPYDVFHHRAVTCRSLLKGRDRRALYSTLLVAAARGVPFHIQAGIFNQEFGTWNMESASLGSYGPSSQPHLHKKG